MILVDQFKKFSENCSDKDYLGKFKKFSDQQKIKKDTNNQNKEFLLKDSINPFETNFLLNENLPNTKKDIDKLSKKIKLDEEYEKLLN